MSGGGRLRRGQPLFSSVFRGVNQTLLQMESEVDKVLYSDGTVVTVTERMLQVKKTGYDLKGITKYGLSILQPVRIPWLVVLALGIVMVVAGAMNVIPSSWISEGYVDEVLVTGNLVAILLGSVLVMLSTGFLLSVSERYAVSITTADGEHNVVVSNRKEYVTCIVNALNSAFFSRIKTSGEKKVREFTVSGR